MSITLNPLKCPACGASLNAREGQKQLFCSYCGTKILVSDENERTYRHIDEAGVRQAETDRLIRLKELELNEKRTSGMSVLRAILTGLWIVFLLIIITIVLVKTIKEGFTESDAFLILFYIGAPIIGGGGFLIFKVLPDKEKETNLRKSGAVMFPKGLDPFTDQNYETVSSILRGSGFRNVTCVNLHDIKTGLLSDPGKIATITVSGAEISSGGKYYLPDAPIIITYHGK